MVGVKCFNCGRRVLKGQRKFVRGKVACGACALQATKLGKRKEVVNLQLTEARKLKAESDDARKTWENEKKLFIRAETKKRRKLEEDIGHTLDTKGIYHFEGKDVSIYREDVRESLVKIAEGTAKAAESALGFPPPLWALFCT